MSSTPSPDQSLPDVVPTLKLNGVPILVPPVHMAKLERASTPIPEDMECTISTQSSACASTDPGFRAESPADQEPENIAEIALDEQQDTVIEVDYDGPIEDPLLMQEVSTGQSGVDDARSQPVEIPPTQFLDMMDDDDEVFNPQVDNTAVPCAPSVGSAQPDFTPKPVMADTPILSNDTPAEPSSTPMDTSADSAPSTEGKANTHVPTVILMIGMAGSGKSTLMHRMLLDLQTQGKRVYSINLDPAVRNLPYPINIDIRETIDYKQAMKHFKLGPNGAIMTCLNLFATRFDQVLELIDKRASELDYILIDTPGQIEVFTWSASGQIICDTLAVAYPTVVCYTVDTVRCTRPVCFMSNMVYCCSILYKTKLPFICAFNKVDVMKHDFVKAWLGDFREFSNSLKESETTYLEALSRDMSLALEEFYRNLNNCGVSAKTGEGMHEFRACLEQATDEYQTHYLDYLHDQKMMMKERRERIVQSNIEKFEKTLDMAKSAENEESPLLGDILDNFD